jgi:hypothetical protein
MATGMSSRSALDDPAIQSNEFVLRKFREIKQGCHPKEYRSRSAFVQCDSIQCGGESGEHCAGGGDGVA